MYCCWDANVLVIHKSNHFGAQLDWRGLFTNSLILIFTDDDLAKVTPSNPCCYFYFRSMLISTYRTQRMNQDWCCSIVKSFFLYFIRAFLNIFITCFLIVYTHFQWWLKICVVRVIWWQIRNLLSTRLIVKMTLYTR